MPLESERGMSRRKRVRLDRRKGKLKQDKFGRYHIRFKDDHAKRVYHIEAPNNVFFNEDLSITHAAQKRKPDFNAQKRGRQLVPFAQ